MKIEEMHYSIIIKELDKAFDVFEKLYGKLNEGNHFDLYEKHMIEAVVNFNKDNGTNYDPADTLDHVLALNEDDEDMQYMNEALENWNNLQAELKAENEK